MKIIEMEDLVYKITTAKTSSSTTLKYSPITGTVTSITVHFPAGCQQRVELFLWYKRMQVFPHPPDGLVGDDMTKTYPLYQSILNHDPLEIRILNHDTVNPHTVVATVHIDGEATE